jgi:hypothetical protein
VEMMWGQADETMMLLLKTLKELWGYIPVL